MSEDGKLEKEVNGALKLYLESGKRLEKVVEILTRIVIENLNNTSKEKIADTLVGGDRGQDYIENPIDVSLLKHKKIIEVENIDQ
jgi:intergrase/recombinase